MNCLRPAKHVANILRKFISGETDNTPLLPVNITNKLKSNIENNLGVAMIPSRV